jgi:putative transcriptional regulator
MKKSSIFDKIKSGLDDSIAFSRGELSLRTTDLPSPPPAAPPRSIIALRRDLRMSQALFAATLNVSTRTVQSWEQGLRTPSDASLRLLQIIRTRPDVLGSVMAQPKTRTARARV